MKYPATIVAKNIKICEKYLQDLSMCIKEQDHVKMVKEDSA